MGNVIHGTLVTVEFFLPFDRYDALDCVESVVNYTNDILAPELLVVEGTNLMGFAEIGQVEDEEIQFLVNDDGEIEDVMRY